MGDTKLPGSLNPALQFQVVWQIFTNEADSKSATLPLK